MEKQIRRYYKQKQSGGRSTAARIADGVVLRLILAFACYLWFQSNVKNQLVAIALTVATMGLLFLALGLYRGLAFEKFVNKERERLRDVVLRERLLLLSEEEFRALCLQITDRRGETEQVHLRCSQRASALDEDAILDAFHAAQAKDARTLILCTLSPLTAKATAILKRLPVEAICITQDQVLKEARGMAGYAVTDEDIEDYIVKEQSVRDARRKRMQTQPFASGRTKKYLICAAVLFAASFVTGYALYYRLLAGLCVLLAGTAFWINRPMSPPPQEQGA